MKRILFIAFIAILTFAACKKDETTTPDNSGTLTYTMKASFKHIPVRYLQSDSTLKSIWVDDTTWTISYSQVPGKVAYMDVSGNGNDLGQSIYMSITYKGVVVKDTLYQADSLESIPYLYLRTTLK